MVNLYVIEKQLLSINLLWYNSTNFAICENEKTNTREAHRILQSTKFRKYFTLRNSVLLFWLLAFCAIRCFVRFSKYKAGVGQVIASHPYSIKVLFFHTYQPFYYFIRHISAKFIIYPPIFKKYFVPFFSPTLIIICLSINCSKSL